MPAASGWQGRRPFGLSRPPDGRQVAAEAHGTGEGRPPLVLPADAITQEVTMSSTAPLADTAADLARSFAGQILRPADPGYEEARWVHNGPIDKPPALIARCRGLADIADSRPRCAAAATTWRGSRRPMAA